MKRAAEVVGYEWHEWSHKGKGVPWRVNAEEFNTMLLNGWEIVTVYNDFTLLRRLVEAPAPAEAGQEIVCMYCGKTEARHPGFNVEGKYVPFCDSDEHTSFFPAATPQPAPQDVIEKMLQAFDDYSKEPYNCYYIRERMTAAYRIAEEHRDGEWVAYAKELSVPNETLWQAGYNTALKDIAKLVSRRTPETKEPEERVTIVPWVHNPERLIVLVDGWNPGNHDGFKDRRDAERYAAGLRAELVKGEK